MGQKVILPQERSALPTGLILAAFQRALDLAASFAGATSPNPPVGCILLDAEGCELAAAAHEKAGMAHAEAAAIAKAKANGSYARIHTLVVTLEPCNHTGRTAPCVEAILESPAVAVWFGAADPNRQVTGGGAAALACAGLMVGEIAILGCPHGEVLARQARRLIAPFAKHAQTGLPFVTIKQALDAHGSMIPPLGQKTFTSPDSLDLAHKLRKRADGIITGSGTILADRPEFTVRRVPDFAAKQRHLVILDRSGSVPLDYVAAARARGFLVAIEDSLVSALTRLGMVGAQEVLVEAGPTLTGLVLASGLWDEHLTITSPARAGEADAISIQHRPTSWLPAERDADVFRHY